MPAENEFKWVLEIDPEGIGAAMTAIPGTRTTSLRQGYVTPENRVREIVEDGKTSYLFTFKYPVAGELLELEQPISKEDFDALWSVCGRRLAKTRFVLAQDKAHWDVDLLAEDGDVYCAVAEAEVARGLGRPPLLPALAPFLVAAVDDRKTWSNHALSDPMRARVLIEHLRETIARQG